MSLIQIKDKADKLLLPYVQEEEMRLKSGINTPGSWRQNVKTVFSKISEPLPLTVDLKNTDQGISFATHDAVLNASVLKLDLPTSMQALLLHSVKIFSDGTYIVIQGVNLSGDSLDHTSLGISTRFVPVGHKRKIMLSNAQIGINWEWPDYFNLLGMKYAHSGAVPIGYLQKEKVKKKLKKYEYPPQFEIVPGNGIDTGRDIPLITIVQQKIIPYISVPSG